MLGRATRFVELFLTLWALGLLICEFSSAGAILVRRADLLDWLTRVVGHVCHQIPSRVPWVNGEPTVLCVRCIGMYSGVFVAPPVIRALISRVTESGVLPFGGGLVALCVIEYLLDRIFPFRVGMILRWLTGLGLGFGVMAVLYVARRALERSRA